MTDMTPLDTYFDHAQRPRNMGRMLDAHGTGNVGSIVSGRALRFFMSVEGDRVAAAKFQVFACQEQVAAASVLSELVVGKSLEECRNLGHADIAAALGGLEPDQLPPQLWGLAGLKDAIAHLEGSDGLVARLDTTTSESPLLCRCHGVDEATVKELVRSGAADLPAVQAQSPVGSGCGTCRRDVERVIAEVQDAPAPTVAASSTGAKGRIALMRAITQQLQDVLAAHPGCEIWDLQGMQVTIRCPAESQDEPVWEQLQDRCERRLKDEVDPLLQVSLAFG
ncbi:MAG: hypothetical protein EA402_06000 [Planctomycetota bacterium]|nr:MAG: hypothetical protein EA402_06000 [Planctomycetota bacterium]